METTRRKHTRQACTPCRDRKRKCDGREPCVTCTTWGYECFYESRRTRRARLGTPQAARQDSVTTPPAANSVGPHVDPVARPQSLQSIASAPSTVGVASGTDNGGLVRRLEANSGAAFVRKLSLKIDPTKAPKLNLFGWNLGARLLSSQLDADAAPILPVVEITSLEHIKSLAQAYFHKVDPCYGFIDQRQFFERLDIRWKTPLIASIYDSVLAGVAAIGCLFSQRRATMTELHLVRSARSSLDNHHLSSLPSLDLVTGWTLRTIYLRLTDSPHSTWMASSTLMHLLEAAGLHPESNSVLLPSAPCDPDLKRRIVGVAHHLNAWTSFDLGLSRVSFQKDDLPSLPSPRPGDFTAEVLGLLPVSVSLDPGRLKEDTDLTLTLSKILGGRHTESPSVMAQCNLVLCILRRIHTQNLDISSALAEEVLALLKKGLGCARSMVVDCYAWHQVANVPFQIICVLLVLDMRSSLAMLPEAMHTLNLVASTYETETMKEAYSAACLLVMLHQQRRKDDIAIFGEALHQAPGINNLQQQGQTVSPLQLNASAEDFSWLEALVADLPGLQRVDLDQFWNADMMNGYGQPGGSG